MGTIELIATTPMGLEAVVARELKLLGYENLRNENGRVHFTGELKDICRANLWLRSAGRVLVNMGQFPARTFEELFEGVRAIDWPAWIPEEGIFPVNGRSQKSLLTSVPACQSIVKKAVVESLKASYHTEWLPETSGQYVIEVTLHNDEALITLDTSGEGLHKRGYRTSATEAPLRETLAAALVQLSRWEPGRPLYDPFCGSGTILIEAAMIGWNIAPGLRRRFYSEDWPIIGTELWEQAREEAYDEVRDDIPLDITGTDIDEGAIAIAEAAVRRAGFGNEIRLDVQPVSRAKPVGDCGVIITNPPYGERLGDDRSADLALRQFGKSALYLPDWSYFIISPSDAVETYMGRNADKRRKLYNGRIACQFYQYFGKLPKR